MSCPGVQTSHNVTEITLFELIKTFTELPGPGGDEWIVQNFLLDRWRPQVEKTTLTPVGNLIAEVGGRGPRLLLAAHADEICFVVKYIAENSSRYEPQPKDIAEILKTIKAHATETIARALAPLSKEDCVCVLAGLDSLAALFGEGSTAYAPDFCTPTDEADPQAPPRTTP